jgi:hypothetical protein
MLGAVGTWTYHPTAVPRILRTPEYWREIEGVAIEDASVTGPHRIEVWAIVGEAALLCQSTSEAVRTAQHRRLRTPAESAHVDLRILPWSGPAVARYPQEFSMVDHLTPEGDNGVVCLRSPSRIQFIDRPDEIARYHAAFHQLASDALDPDESLARLRALA